MIDGGPGACRSLSHCDGDGVPGERCRLSGRRGLSVSASIEFDTWVAAAREAPIGEFVSPLGLRKLSSVEYAGPCPSCGGRDRFSINLRKGICFCRKCPLRGDVIALAMAAHGVDFLNACELLTGTAPPGGTASDLDLAALARIKEEQRARREESERQSERFRRFMRDQARRLWERGFRPAGTPVEQYLNLRGVELPPSAWLRFVPDAPLYGPAGNKAPPTHVGPAMVAGIVGGDLKFAGVHITWIDLSERSGKAFVPDPKTGEILPAKKVWGSQGDSHLELVRVDGPRGLVIGEGIETVLSMRDALRHAGRGLRSCAFWTSINLHNLGGPAVATVPHPTDKHRNGHVKMIAGPVPSVIGGIPIPETVERILLLGDGDSDPFHVRMTLERAAQRWKRPGRIIRAAMAPHGQDFNSFLRGDNV